MDNYQNGLHLYYLAEQEWKNKNYLNAISSYTNALSCLDDINENYLKPQILFGRAKCYFMLTDYIRVILDLTDDLVVKKMNNEMLNYRGFASFALGFFTGAEQDFSKVLITEPENLYALRWRGELYLTTWQLNKAITDFEKYMKLCSTSEEIFNKVHFIHSYVDHYLREVDRIIQENTFKDLPQVGEESLNEERREELGFYLGSKTGLLPTLINQFKFEIIGDLPIRRRIYQHHSNITSIYISDDSRYLFSGDESGNVILWSLPDQRIRFTYAVGSKIIQQRVSRNNRYCASINEADQIHIWDILTKKLLITIEKEMWLDEITKPSYESLNFEFSPDEKYLLINKLDADDFLDNEIKISTVNLSDLSITRFDAEKYKDEFGRITGIHYLNNQEFGIEMKTYYWVQETKCNFLQVNTLTGKINTINPHYGWIDDDFFITRNRNLLLNTRSGCYGGGGEDGPDGDFIYFKFTRTDNQEIIIQKTLFDTGSYPKSLSAYGDKGLGRDFFGTTICLFNLNCSSIEFYYGPAETKINVIKNRFQETSYQYFNSIVSNLEISPSGDFGILTIDRCVYMVDFKKE